jgi:hypothetical protein
MHPDIAPSCQTGYETKVTDFDTAVQATIVGKLFPESKIALRVELTILPPMNFGDSLESGYEFSEVHARQLGEVTDDCFVEIVEFLMAWPNSLWFRRFVSKVYHMRLLQFCVDRYQAISPRRSLT